MSREIRLSVPEISRMLELVERVAEQGKCTPSQAIDRMEALAAGHWERPRRNVALAEFIARMSKLRLRRNEIIGAPLFRDPAWDMLLELFVAHDRGEPVSVSSLCYASGVPPTTALRHLARLEEHGLIRREGDRKDNRRWFVYPTEKAVSGIARAGTMLIEHSRATNEA